MHSTTNWLSGGPFIKYRCGHLWTATVLAFTIVARPDTTVGISLFYNFDLKHIQTLKISLNRLLCILFVYNFGFIHIITMLVRLIIYNQPN